MHSLPASISAVAKRLRDASCLSVVSCNSTKRRVETFIVSYVGVQLNALFCCLWHNVEASCYKHFVVCSRNQYRRLLPVMCHNLRDGGHPLVTAFTIPACSSGNTGSQAKYRLRIAISAYPPAFDATVRGFLSEYCYAIWHGKARMVWLPDGETHTQTYIRALHDDIGSAYA